MRDPKLLLELSAHPEFAPYLREIMQQRPVVPLWSRDVSSDDWVYRSGLQAGFDIFASFFESDSED